MNKAEKKISPIVKEVFANPQKAPYDARLFVAVLGCICPNSIKEMLKEE